MNGRGVALLAALAAACGGGGGAPADGRPNLVLVLADDQRYDTLGCNGATLVETPELDRLAREGARFTRAYVVTSLCCPARASLLTSLYAHRTGIRNNEDREDFLGANRDLAEVLQEAGYATGFFGKWHVHNPGAAPQPGFDKWVSFEGQGQYEDETFNVDGVRRRIEGFNTDVLFDLAMEWMRAQERPYLCILSLKNLHRPFVIPERHRQVDERVPIARPASFDDPLEGLPSYVQRVRNTLRNCWFDDGTTYEENLRGYHQLVLSIDDNLGRLRRALEDQGELDRTALAYTSDGGFMWGEHGLFKKRTAYEPSIHVPLLVRYPPAVPAGTEVARLALNVDLAPTLAALAGVAVPAEWQGADLAPLWSGGSAPGWRADFLYTDGWGKFVDGPQELAVVGERFKYVRYRRARIEEALFDREADPDERVDLAADPTQAERLEDFRGRLRELLAGVGAPPSWMEPVEPGSVDEED